MGDAVTNLVFPALARLAVAIPGALLERLEAFVAERGWNLQDGVRILLAYGAALHAPGPGDPTAEETVNAWGAARAELALLRHRAYLADESVRTLRMNVTALEAANAQYRRSLPAVEAEVARLAAAVRALEARCDEQGVTPPPEAPRQPAAAVGPLDVFHRLRAARRDTGPPAGGMTAFTRREVTPGRPSAADPAPGETGSGPSPAGPGRLPGPGAW
ncbi:MAG: hypothetical protein QN122_12975 [Armatimonadota bacterium]|nr:hypothetical protein [Armatimonadota bacterium]MDR7480745.1 hypothetical protein [Armatimonadota bacterium]MDR7488909.1 hypothetical protein [Armatimonadota bacterium]MDR7492348.1 hypothetical protein [Armatimonadota bacterium]MDR7503080.1 hypothetical protein [Armatimonadota bacterium]